MVTPFRDDHAVDLDRAQELASHLVDSGSEAIVVAGSTGESPTLPRKEKADLFRAGGGAIPGRGNTIWGHGTSWAAGQDKLTSATRPDVADRLSIYIPCV